MTSNVGASTLSKNKFLGFTTESEDQEYKDMKGKVMDELKRSFRPEFLNRIDELIVFHALEKKHIREIITLMADQLKTRLFEQGIELELTEAAKDKITDLGFDPEYGARPLRRALQKQVEDRLSEELLKGSISKGQKAIIDVKDDELFVKAVGEIENIQV
jgi:ATP-dependent Clp protease ATP-binding subunit ClpC